MRQQLLGTMVIAAFVTGALPLHGSGWVGVAWSGTEAVSESSTKKHQPFRYDPHGKRDPFVSLVRDGKLWDDRPRGPVDTSKPVLYGIVCDAAGPCLALINDSEVRVGDTIGGYQVKDIRGESVVLTDGGEPVVLQIMFENPSGSSPSGATTGGDHP